MSNTQHQQSFEERFGLRERVIWMDPDTATPEMMKGELVDRGADAVVMTRTAPIPGLMQANRMGAVAVWLDYSQRIRTDFLIVRNCPLGIRFLDRIMTPSWKSVAFPRLWVYAENAIKTYARPNFRVLASPLITVFTDTYFDPMVDVFYLERWRRSSGRPIIVQTWVENSTSIEYLAQCQQRLLSLNPSLEYALFSDYDMLRFVAEHYPPEYLDAMNKILPGAYRSDFFRLLFLKKYGGIYCDISLQFQVSFRRMLGTPVFVIDNQNGDYCLFNAFMIVPHPEHPVVNECIRIIMDHVNSRVRPSEMNYSPDPCLHLTGPCALGQAFLAVYGGERITQSPNAYPDCLLLRHYHNLQSIRSIDKTQVIARTRHHLGKTITDKMHQELVSPHYSRYCHRNQVWLLDEDFNYL